MAEISSLNLRTDQVRLVAAERILRTGPNNSTFCVCAPLEDTTVTGETNQ
jgi:hypothetical protein